MQVSVLLAIIAATILAALPMLVRAEAPPEADTCLPGLGITLENAGAATLSWPAVAAATHGYQVMVKPENGDWFPVTPQVPPSSTSYTYPAMIRNLDYEFTVVALSGPSEQVGTFCHILTAYSPPPCPANLAAARTADGGIRVTWDPVPGADGYNLYGPTADGSLLFMGHINNGTVGMMLDSEPAAGAELRYQVTTTSGPFESPGCAIVGVEIASVPFFPTPVAWGAGIVGIAIAGLLVARRR